MATGARWGRRSGGETFTGRGVATGARWWRAGKRRGDAHGEGRGHEGALGAGKRRGGAHGEGRGHEGAAGGRGGGAVGRAAPACTMARTGGGAYIPPGAERVAAHAAR